MSSQPQFGQSQARILRTCTALCQLRPAWAGNFILSLGLNSQGAALSIAANIAGAVSLAIDHDSSHLREVVRAGACDFVVNTLDEAIRAMKNEIRKRAPLSVALNADPELVIKEILERGLAPQLFTTFLPPARHIDEAAIRFQALGAALVDFREDKPAADFLSSESLLAPLLRSNAWSLYTFTFETLAGLRAFDTRALSLLHEEGAIRHRWLQAAPRILRRQHPPARSLWLTREEFQTLTAEFSGAHTEEGLP